MNPGDAFSLFSHIWQVLSYLMKTGFQYLVLNHKLLEKQPTKGKGVLIRLSPILDESVLGTQFWLFWGRESQGTGTQQLYWLGTQNLRDGDKNFPAIVNRRLAAQKKQKKPQKKILLWKYLLFYASNRLFYSSRFENTFLLYIIYNSNWTFASEYSFIKRLIYTFDRVYGT